MALSTADPERAKRGLLRARAQTIAQPSGRVPGLHPLGLSRGRDGAVFVPNPPGAEPVPLIVALHGAGGLASQMIDALAGPAGRRGIAVLAPESRSSTWDVIRGGYGPDVAFIDAALEHVFAICPVASDRIAIAGFSDGASYALSLGLTNGGLFSDVLAFSPGFMAPAQPSGHPRVFISHGVGDVVLPIERCSRRLAPALRRAGYDLDYREFAGGHVMPSEMVDGAIARFLDRR